MSITTDSANSADLAPPPPDVLVFTDAAAGKVGELIREGNVRRIIVKDEKGNTFIEIPLTVATVGVIAVPVLAALGTIAALIAHFTLGVEKVEPHTGTPPQEPRSGTDA